MKSAAATTRLPMLKIVAMRRVGERLGSHEFCGATLYSTLQPCGMCSTASIWAKLGRIVYGAGRQEVHAMYFEDRHMNSVDYITDAFKDDIALQGGILAVECAALYIGPDEYVPKAKWVNISRWTRLGSLHVHPTGLEAQIPKKASSHPSNESYMLPRTLEVI